MREEKRYERVSEEENMFPHLLMFRGEDENFQVSTDFPKLLNNPIGYQLPSNDASIAKDIHSPIRLHGVVLN
jgi:hypothetical protein